MDKTINKLNIGSKLDPIDERSYDESKEDYGNDMNLVNAPDSNAPANSQNDESLDSIVNNVNHHVGSMSSHS
jgi:hypothetical protein